jgi:hypothetical protein
MKMLKSLLYTLLFLAGAALPKSAVAQCPSAIFNNTSTIALKDLTCIPPGTYNLEFVWDDGQGINSVVLNQPAACVTSFNLANDLGGGSSASGAGLLISCGANTFPSPDCLQGGSVIILLRNTVTNNIVLDLSFENGVLGPGCFVSCTPLPIILSSFTGSLVNGQAKLNWTTSSESNGSHFWVTESCDGMNFVRIAKITAVGYSVSNQNYTYTDPTLCSTISYYRLEMVDNDCSRRFSNIISVYKPGNGIAPVASNAYDPCVGAYDPKITGPDRICDNPNYAYYQLLNQPSGTTVTWSVTPAGYATVMGTSARVRVKRINNYSGTVTLRASFSNGTSVSKNIAMGAPALNVITSNYYSGNTMIHTATVSPLLAGTTAADYQWYQGEYFLGTGSSMTFYVAPRTTVYYQVRVNTACGTSVYYGSAYNPRSGGGGCDEIYPKVSPNPVRGELRLLIPVCPLRSSKSGAKITELYTVRIYDKVKNLRRSYNNVRVTNGAVQLPIGELPMGNYIVEVTDGKRRGSAMIMVE